MEKEMYLKLTADNIETIKFALRTQCGNSDNINCDGSENDDLIAKICCQENMIRRPYIVTGIHDNGRQYLPKRIIIMAEDKESAVEYARKKLEKTSEDVFKVKHEDVHEMTDNEILEVKE